MKRSQILHEKVSNNESLFRDDLINLHNQLNDDLKILQQSINMATSNKGTPKEKQSTSEPSEEGSKSSSPTNMVDINVSNHSHKLETSVTKKNQNSNESVKKNNIIDNNNRIDTGSGSISNNRFSSHQEDEQIIHSSTDNTISTSNLESRKTTKKRKRKRNKNRSTEKKRKGKKESIFH